MLATRLDAFRGYGPAKLVLKDPGMSGLWLELLVLGLRLWAAETECLDV